MTRQPPLVLEGVSVGYGERLVVNDISLTIEAGQSVAVMGPSGSGKSSLLAAIVGLTRPRAGSVQVAGTDVHRLRRAALARLRREQVGVVFQFGELLPSLTVEENVALPAIYARTPYDDAIRRARGLLESVGIGAFDARAEVLSGGERQRVALARALINDPPLILADEPTGSLDQATKDGVAELLFAQPRERACALLVVTHDTTIGERADVVVRLGDVIGGALRPAPTDARA
jgi:lipoprotein-releasing system ATP-binding protein